MCTLPSVLNRQSLGIWYGHENYSVQLSLVDTPEDVILS